jgi:UDP-N-acetyl-D-glucosamine dehydrogenase
MRTKDLLLQKIERRTARVGVIGLGYVGLPLAVEFARSGFHVLGYDVSDRVVKLINDGHSHVGDVPASAVAALVKEGCLEATSDPSRLGELDAMSIAVPTPLAKTRDPDMSYVLTATATVARSARPGQVIVLECTTYPGTTRELLQPAMEERGLVVGRDVFLAFSPERVDPGNERWTTKNTPKVVGGITADCTEVAVALYGACIERVVPVSSPEAAELTKLLENTFRAVNIAMVNEMAIVCDKLGVDVWEVIDAAATKPFGFMRFTPGPGIGGHCIPLDPHYLAWKMRTLNYKTRFIDLASEINSEMPAYVVEKVASALNDERKAVNGSHVLVVGVAYKRDIDDVRESPALDVMRLLEELGADVSYHDPYVPTFLEGGVRHESVPLSDDELKRCDAVVIVTNHSSIDYQRLVNRSALIVDTRNATARLTPGRARVVSLSSSHTPTAPGKPSPVAAGKVVA